MLIGCVAGLVFTFYLLCVPIEFALMLRTHPEPAFGAGLAVFESRFARRNAERRISGTKKHLPWQKFSLDAQKIRSLRALKYLLRHLQIERLSLTGSVSTGDAAQTALICGFMEVLSASLTPFDPQRRIQLALSPDFSGSGSQFCFLGMVSLRAGHIIPAALIGATTLIKGRISQWKSTRLRIL